MHTEVMLLPLDDQLLRQVEACGALGVSVDHLGTFIELPAAMVVEHRELFKFYLERGRLLAFAKLTQVAFDKAGKLGLGRTQDSGGRLSSNSRSEKGWTQPKCSPKSKGRTAAE